MAINRKSTNTFQFEGDVLRIKTQNGSEILVDMDDYEKLCRYSWCINKRGYAVCNTGKSVVRMHRYILDAKKGEIVDHINHNVLDNRKSNLRICTQQENLRNVLPARTSKTKEVGIGLTGHGKYNVRITHNRKEIHIGNYNTIEEAVVARTKAEKKYHSEFGAHQTGKYGGEENE